MSKKSSTNPLPLLSVIQSLRPEAAMEYRLLDFQNRLFPPSSEPGYRVIPRVELPVVAPGRYCIRFEDGQGQPVAYGDDGVLAEIEIDGPLVTASPDALEIRKERGWQKIEKREIRHKAEHTRNEGLQGMMGLVLDSQRLVFEANKRVEQGHQHVAEMMNRFASMQNDLMGQFAVLQSSMMEQQQRLVQHAQQATPPAPQENWATATPKILDKLGEVIKVAILATAQEKKGRNAEPAPVDAEFTAGVLAARAAAESHVAASAALPAVPRAADRVRPTELPPDAQDRPKPSEPPTSSVTASPPSAPPPSPAASSQSPEPPSPPAAPPPPPRTPPPPAASPPPEPPPPAAASSLPLPSGSDPRSAQAKPASANAPAQRTPLGPHDPLVAVYYKTRAQIGLFRAILPLARLAASPVWREMKRRIISLPDTQLHLAVSTRDNFLAWLEWITEPGQVLFARG